VITQSADFRDTEINFASKDSLGDGLPVDQAGPATDGRVAAATIVSQP